MFRQQASQVSWAEACSQQQRTGSPGERSQRTRVPHPPLRPETPGPATVTVCTDFPFNDNLLSFSHRNFKEIQQRKSNPKNCITSKARGLLQDVTQMAFISQVDILFCKIALLKNTLFGEGTRLRFL